MLLVGGSDLVLLILERGGCADEHYSLDGYGTAVMVYDDTARRAI